MLLKLIDALCSSRCFRKKTSKSKNLTILFAKWSIQFQTGFQEQNCHLHKVSKVLPTDLSKYHENKTWIRRHENNIYVREHWDNTVKLMLVITCIFNIFCTLRNRAQRIGLKEKQEHFLKSVLLLVFHDVHTLNTQRKKLLLLLLFLTPCIQLIGRYLQRMQEI